MICCVGTFSTEERGDDKEKERVFGKSTPLVNICTEGVDFELFLWINIHHVVVYSMRLILEERCIRASNNVNRL